LLEDFQDALTGCRGYDILLIAQTQNHANEHLRTLKNLILNSAKYSRYLITNPSELLLKEEKTKVGVAYIKNPDNQKKPTRIIALGATSEGSIWSWKNVKKIHMSDVTSANLVDDSGLFAAAFSRLANTDGSLIIEAPPRGPKGKTYEIYQQILEHKSQFKLFVIKAEQAVTHGLITLDFLDEERQRLGPLYPQYYEAEFIAGRGNVYSHLSIDKAVERGTLYDPQNVNKFLPKYLLIDEGFSSSKFAVLIAQWDKHKRQLQILHAEELQSPLYEDALNYIFTLRERYGNVINIGFDASRPELGMSLKKRVGENYNWQYVQEKIQQYKKQNLNPAHYMKVVPVLFTLEQKAWMTSHSRRLLDDPRGLVAIHPSFTVLIDALKAAIFDDRGILDKEESPHNDILDTFQMLTTFLTFRPKGE